MVEIVFNKQVDPENNAIIMMKSFADSENLPTYLTDEEKKLLKAVLKRESEKSKAGSMLQVDAGTRRITLVWADQEMTAEKMQILGGKLYAGLKKSESAIVDCNELENPAEAAYNLAFGLKLASYRFDKYLTKRKPEDFPKLETVNMQAKEASQDGFKYLEALSAGVRYTRDLTNEPSNNMTPEIMAADLKRLEYLGLKVEVLDQNAMREKEFNLAMSVAQGSENQPRVVVIRWNGRSDEDVYDLGLVGKGVTFDSGGISLKPGAGMWDMKQDMAGAAAVAGAMKAAALQKLPLNVVAVVGLVENMPSGAATRPGDIVRSMSGQTVEILNTDAEGRLVLADCLWYIQKTFGVKKVIDIATLTGAILVALGQEMAGVMGNNQTFVNMIINSGNECGERVWQLPLTEAYNKMMDSSIADMKNISESRDAGSITAACFLQRFVERDVEWAHLDIAGMDNEKKGRPLTPKGASGFGVRLFNQIMKNL